MDPPARQLLAEVDALLGHASASTAGLWPRAAALLTRQALEKLVDLLGPCGDLASQDNVAVLVAKGDRDLPCVLIDSEVQHDWFSYREKGAAKSPYPMGETVLLNEAPLS